MPSMLFLCCQVLVGWRPLGGSERLTRHSRAQVEPPDRSEGGDFAGTSNLKDQSHQMSCRALGPRF
jgi:hypothetical protein